MIKKIIGGIVLAALFGGSVCGVVYGVKYNNLSKSEEVVNYDQQAKTIRDLQTQLAKAKGDCDTLQVSLDKMTAENTANYALVEQLREEKAALEVEVSELEAQGNANAANVAQLYKQIDTKDAKIVELNATIAANEETIATLTTERDNLSATLASVQAQLDSLTEENDDNLVQIALLEQQLLEAQNEITRLNGLMADYEDIKNEASQVIFYVGDKNVQTDAIKPNYCVTSVPQSTDDYRIDGWQLEDGTSVDPLTYEITEDTNFYAVYVNKYAVTFMDGETVVSSEHVATDSFTWAIAPEKDGWTFEGWYVGETKYTTEDTYTLTGDVTFTAQYYKWESVSEITRSFAYSEGFLSTDNITSYVNPIQYYSSLYTSDNYPNLSDDIVNISGTILYCCYGCDSICLASYRVENVNDIKSLTITFSCLYGDSYTCEIPINYVQQDGAYFSVYPFYAFDVSNYGSGANVDIWGYNQTIERYVTLY